MRKYNVLLAQFNNQYGGQIYIPYSVGLLKTYACQNENVLNRFNFLPFVVERNNVSNIIDKDTVVDVLGISCYVWNWQISLDFAKHVRENNPECLIILGGPQVPNVVPKDFFTKNPFVNMLCHSEGEQTFEEILLKFKTSEDVAGVSYFDKKNNCIKTTIARPPIKDLNIIPSPYLTGVFDYLFDSSKYEYMPIWETNRGCPFKCTFCDWGFVASKVRKFNNERLIKEIDYFSEKKSSLIFGADANFGIFKRDLDFAKALAEKKKETGYPKEFRVCFTKNTTNRVFDLAKIFAEAGMNKGVSISMQSLNKTVLENIKRNNIKMSFFKELQEKYVQEGLKTYTELILPLPGETYESFTDGIDRLLASSQHSGIVVYNCSIMPNAEMGRESYQKKYGLDITEIPVFLAHSNKNDNEVVEKEFITVGTKSMPRNEWKKTFKFSWVVQSMHLLGVLQVVSVVLYNLYDIKYKDFYQKFLESDGAIINTELSIIDDLLDDVLVGKGFDQYLDNFEPISWPPEEAAFLRILEHLDDFYKEVHKFISDQYPCVDDNILTDLILYQKNILKNYWDIEDKNISFNYDLKTYFENCKVGNVSDLVCVPITYTYQDTKYYHSDKKMFSKEVVWFGRKGGGFFKNIKNLS